MPVNQSWDSTRQALPPDLVILKCIDSLPNQGLLLDVSDTLSSSESPEPVPTVRLASQPKLREVAVGYSGNIPLMTKLGSFLGMFTYPFDGWLIMTHRKNLLL